MIQLNDYDGEVFLEKAWLSDWNLYSRLLDDTPWRQDEITLFGKTHPVPRLQAWYGDKGTSYTYSNIELKPLPWTDDLFVLKCLIEAASGLEFNSVLVNLYRDGNDKNGWHADNEKELGTIPEIASLSLGQSRHFHLKHRKEAHKLCLELEHGDLLIMTGKLQENWKHQLTPTKKQVNSRINLTFRKILD